MAVQLLEQIRQAEEAAEQLRQQAQREAREIVKASEEASAHARRDAEQGVRTHYREQMDAQKLRIQEELAQAGHALQAAQQEEIDKARARIPQAAQRISERILAHGDR